ncbi:MAG: HEPN domain-containing protein [Anaerolineae bacterium]|nr:HEPN domain-containing protein [Anaerolineae bacterium]
MSAEYPYLEKAGRFLSSAQLLADHGDLDSAASRLYYAMFYIAETLLDTVGKRFSSHQAVLAAYGVEFANPPKTRPSIPSDASHSV